MLSSLCIRTILRVCFRVKNKWRRSGFSEDRYYVFDVNDEESVVSFEIDGDRAFWVEQDFVVLLEGEF